MLDWLRIDPVAFTIPVGNGFDIFWYAILIIIGIALGAWWAGREIEKRGLNSDELYNGLLIVVVFGYLSARIWYVVQDMLANNVSYSLIEAVNIRQGGVNILGGFIGAFIAAYIYIRWRKLSFWDYADVTGPAVLLAQGIGRWGNFINQELYGQPTDLPWGLIIDQPNRIAPYRDLVVYPLGTRFHPTFLYESILLLLGFAVLAWLNGRYRDRWPAGTLFGLFLIWWGGGRALVEFFRPDQPSIGSSVITYSMLVAIGLALVGLLIILDRNKKITLFGNRRRSRRVRKPKPRRSN